MSEVELLIAQNERFKDKILFLAERNAWLEDRQHSMERSYGNYAVRPDADILVNRLLKCKKKLRETREELVNARKEIDDLQIYILKMQRDGLDYDSDSDEEHNFFV